MRGDSVSVELFNGGSMAGGDQPRFREMLRLMTSVRRAIGIEQNLFFEI